jgi:RNA polymerase sigma-70 factor (ECF subfamily)
MAVMAPADHTVDGTANSALRFDPESAEWVRTLSSSGAEHTAALDRLHATLLRIARGELRRRSGRLPITGPEVDDLAFQAAADALIAITSKVSHFRGDSRFTTWAYKFVIFEVSATVGRHFWQKPTVSLDAEDWDRLPDRFGLEPAQESEWRDLAGALRRAVDQDLTDRQRRIFVAVALNGVPPDALATELRSTRGAIYKTMFDTRRKLRAALVANGYLNDD